VADELPISYDKRELRSIITAFKAMDDEAVSQANQNLARWLLMRQMKSKPMHSQGLLVKKQLEELQLALKSRPVPKSESSLMALQVSAFLVAVAHKNSGRVMNLEVIACVSSPEEHRAKVAETLATLSTQPFVRFSLN